MIFLSVQDVQAAKKKHQVSSELRPSPETWLHAVSGLSGLVTKLDQCGECLRDLGVPGGRSGKEQVTHAQESWLWASTPPCPAGHMGRCRGPCLYTRITSIPEPGRGGKQTAQPERRQKPGPPSSPDCVGSRPRGGYGAKKISVSVEGASEG